MAAQKKNINLLPKEDLEKTSAGKVIKWALTIGRYIIIFTELIVIVAFLSRFKLDRDLADLNEAIEDNMAIIDSYGGLEEDVRFLQKKIKVAKNIKEAGEGNKKVLTELAKMTPLDTYYLNLSKKDDLVSVEGYSLSNVGIATFLYQLRSKDNYSKINLESIATEGKDDPAIEFKVRFNSEK